MTSSAVWFIFGKMTLKDFLFLSGGSIKDPGGPSKTRMILDFTIDWNLRSFKLNRGRLSAELNADRFVYPMKLFPSIKYANFPLNTIFFVTRVF
jgi:hypothetical protein